MRNFSLCLEVSVKELSEAKPQSVEKSHEVLVIVASAMSAIAQDYPDEVKRLHRRIVTCQVVVFYSSCVRYWPLPCATEQP